jgi:diguanylate cyclase (GGDEF)-like protein/PAS domain S-box-containing protein
MFIEKSKIQNAAYPLAAFFIIASVLIDGFIFSYRVEAIWLVNILSILVVAFIKGFKAGTILSITITISHIFFNIILFSNHHLLNTIFFSVFFLFISIVFSYLVDELHKKIYIFESFHQSSNAMFWLRFITPEKVHVTEGIARLYGFPRSDFAGNPKLWIENINNEDIHKVKEHEKKYMSGHNSRAEFRIKTKDGDVRWIESYANPIKNSKGKIIMVCGSVIDVTSKKELETKMEYMAYHDAITGLKNRYKLEEDLIRVCKEAPEKNECFSVLFIEVGRHKEINDTIGHNSGDELLQQVGVNLHSLLDQSSYLYRYISQDFVVILQDSSKEATERKVNEIIQRFSNPVTLASGREVYLTPKIGVAYCPDVDLNPEYIMTAASIACATAKKSDVSSYAFYNEHLRNESNRKLAIEDDLQKVIENKELALYYQAKVDLKTNTIVGVESLLRWQHPTGLISPLSFIPIAEYSGAIVPIGEWVIEEACQQGKKWFDDGIKISVSVNVSVIQLKDKLFVQTLQDILNRTNFPAELLILEITESVIISGNEMIEALLELKELGIKLSLDDFGTGFSSLSVLLDLPIDEIKIDRSFVVDMHQSEEKKKLLRNIIKIGKDLHITTVVEGVETLEDVTVLSEENCDIGQGYWFLRPIPADQLNFNELHFKVKSK